MSGRWLSDYDQASVYAEDAELAIAERNRARQKGSSTIGASNKAEKLVKQLSALLSRLNDGLGKDISSYTVTQKEGERRAGLIRQLKARRDQVNSSIKVSGVGMSDDYSRNALFGASSRRGGAEDERTRNMDDQALLQEQDTIMADQDKGLESIARSAQILKHYGTQIGDELDDQNEMLDDLGDGFDNTHRRLTRETQHVVHVTEKAKAGGMFCCIVLLILGIIVVAAIPI